MKKIYWLSSCDTCKRILQQIDAKKRGFELQDIKTVPVTASQLEELKQRAGSYEALFSRRAVRYKQLGLKDRQLGEADYRQYILQDYTFLKRPVVLLDRQIFIGSDPKTLEALDRALG